MNLDSGSSTGVELVTLPSDSLSNAGGKITYVYTLIYIYIHIYIYAYVYLFIYLCIYTALYVNCCTAHKIVHQSVG